MAPPTPDPNVRFVAFGDSATDGPSTRDYPDILRELLGEQPETFANEGIGGETSDEGRVRLDGLLGDGLFPNAEVLFYWEGGNDVARFIKELDPFLLTSPIGPNYPFANQLADRLDRVQADIQSAIAAARAVGLTVYVATYFTLRVGVGECDALPFDVILPLQAANANAYIAMLNDRIRDAASAEGAILVDVEAASAAIDADPANYFNCNHLSAQGNAIVAELFFDAIQHGG